MLKVTQKEMCYHALINKAIRLENECYHYESIISDNNKLINLLNIDVKQDKYGYYDIVKTQIYFSCGLYGNTGQMHYIDWYDNNNIQHSCYVYYTQRNYNKDKKIGC